MACFQFHMRFFDGVTYDKKLLKLFQRENNKLLLKQFSIESKKLTDKTFAPPSYTHHDLAIETNVCQAI